LLEEFVNRSFELVRSNQCADTTGHSMAELTTLLSSCATVSRVHDF
jgi:hypothetical protein